MKPETVSKIAGWPLLCLCCFRLGPKNWSKMNQMRQFDINSRIVHRSLYQNESHLWQLEPHMLDSNLFKVVVAEKFTL